ncbi:MAG: hypothetical protein ACQUYJ_03005, partial [Ferruginibacter sp.]
NTTNGRTTNRFFSRTIPVTIKTTAAREGSQHFNISSFEKLQIGDSLFKQFNSHVVHIYRKGKNDSYVFFGSFY